MAAREYHRSKQDYHLSQSQESFVENANRYLLPLYKRPSILMERGDGVYLWDGSGKR